MRRRKQVSIWHLVIGSVLCVRTEGRRPSRLQRDLDYSFLKKKDAVGVVFLHTDVPTEAVIINMAESIKGRRFR